LGTADASNTGMLQFLVPRQLGLAMPQDIAVAATLIIRFATLWFGVGLGLMALAIMQRRLGNAALAEAEARASTEYRVPSAEC
ncbi:MAG TPA: hypothetical protein VEW94_07000, partial [Chloroflexia bacterium]|nr:hypothetical protein [Chloroflexia bacterium]